jgi:ABC-type multidrug transport system fused ATPase/permease subunit
MTVDTLLRLMLRIKRIRYYDGLDDFVPRDAPLLNDTVEHNIRYGRIDATYDEVMAIAKMAEVDSTINSSFARRT